MSDSTYFMNDLNGEINFSSISYSIDGGKTYKRITQAIADNCVITNKKLNGKILLKSSDKDINGELRDGVLYVDGKPAKYLTPTGETKTVTLQDDRAIDFSDTESIDTTIALGINNIDELPSAPISEGDISDLSYRLIGDISLSTNGESHIETSASRSNAIDTMLMRAIMTSTSCFYVGKDVFGANSFSHDVTTLCLCLEKDLFDYDPSTKTGLDASNKFTVVSNYIHNTLKISDGKNEFNSYKIIQIQLESNYIIPTQDGQHIVFIVIIDHDFSKLTQTINIKLDVLSCKYSSIENTYITVTDKNNDITIMRNCGYHLTSNDSTGNKLSIDVSSQGDFFPQYTCEIYNGDNVAINNSKTNTNEKYVICNSTFNTKEYNVINKNEGETSFYKYNKLRACFDLSSDTIGTINNVFICPSTDIYSCPQKLTNEQYSISQDTTKEMASLANPKLQQPIMFHRNAGEILNGNYDVTLKNSKVIENRNKFNESPLCLYLNYEFEFYDRNDKSYTEALEEDPIVLFNTSYNDTDTLPRWDRWKWGKDDIPLDSSSSGNKYYIIDPGINIQDGDPVMLVIDSSIVTTENITATTTNSYKIPQTDESNVFGVYPTEEDAEADTNKYTYEVTKGFLYTTISLVGVDIPPESVWIKYRKFTKDSLYEFVHKESNPSNPLVVSIWVDKPSSVQEGDTVSIYASLVIKSVKATLATFSLPKQERKEISNAFVYDTGNENYVLFGDMEWAEEPELSQYKSEFGGSWLSPTGISIENSEGSYYLFSENTKDIKIHAIKLTDGKEFIFRNEKQNDSSFESLTKKYPCIPYKSKSEFKEIEYEPWTRFCVNTGKKITITDTNIDENFVWVEYKKELLNTQDRIFKCVPISSKENKDVYSISFDFRNLEMPFGESEGTEEPKSTVETFKLKDLKNMLGSVLFINNSTPNMSEDTYNRFLNIYSVDRWNDFYDLVHSHTYIDFNTIILKMMTQSENAYAHVILNMTTDSEQFYTRNMVNDSSHSDAIEISDNNTAKFLNMALEYRFDPNEETPLPSSNVRFISDNYRVSNNYDDSDIWNVVYNTTAQARTVVEIDRAAYEAFCTEHGHPYSANLQLFFDTSASSLRNCFQANMILNDEFGNSMGSFSLQSDPENWESPYTLTTLENVELDDTGSKLGLFGTIKTYINDEENTDDTYCPAPTSEEMENMHLDIPAHEEGWNPPVYNWYLMSEQIRSSSESDKYILKFTVTEISDEELEAFLNSTLTITGAISETSPFNGGISLTDSNNTYMAFFDASGNNSLYPVKLECDLIKNGTIVGHMTYKMFNSDGETPAQTPQALGGSSRTFTSSLSKITE